MVLKTPLNVFSCALGVMKPTRDHKKVTRCIGGYHQPPWSETEAKPSTAYLRRTVVRQVTLSLGQRDLGLLKLCVGLSAHPCFTLVTLGSPPLDPGSWESHQDLSVLQSAGIVSMRSLTA